MKVCKHRFNHRGSLLQLMLAYLSTVKVCKRFNHRGPLLKLVQAYLSAVMVSKRRFHHRGSEYAEEYHLLTFQIIYSADNLGESV